MKTILQHHLISVLLLCLSGCATTSLSSSPDPADPDIEELGVNKCRSLSEPKKTLSRHSIALKYLGTKSSPRRPHFVFRERVFEVLFRTDRAIGAGYGAGEEKFQRRIYWGGNEVHGEERAFLMANGKVLEELPE